MIYSIFLYNFKSGIILSDISFNKLKFDNSDKKILLAGFLSTISSFFSKLIDKNMKKRQNFKLLQIGDYSFKAYMLFPKLNIDLVFITDSIDYDNIDDLIPNLRKSLFEYYDLFENVSHNNTLEFVIIEDVILKTIRNWINEKVLIAEIV